MSENYIHLGDFEKFVRNRFKNIINGKGLTVPRIAIKIALDDVFKEDASQPNNTGGRGYTARQLAKRIKKTGETVILA